MKKYLLICFCISLLLGCADNEYPKISISQIGHISSSSAIVYTNLVSSGDYSKDLLDWQVCYNTVGNPTVNDERHTSKYDNQANSYAFPIANLSANTTYYVRMFIDDFDANDPIIYSQEVEFKTQSIDSILDLRDNQYYEIISIGNQVWMAENLNYAVGEGAYQNQSSALGVLYNFETANNACPAGWHLPNDEEWMEMEKSLGMEQGTLLSFGFRGDMEGAKLKQPGRELWNGNNLSTNEVGFNALPAGHMFAYGGEIIAEGFGSSAYFYTSSLNENDDPIVRVLSSHENGINRKPASKDDACSVRCVKD